MKVCKTKRVPKPTEVQKLIAKRVFLGLSVGNNPTKFAIINSSVNLISHEQNKKQERGKRKEKKKREKEEKPFVKFSKTKELSNFLEKNLDKNTRRCCGICFSQSNVTHCCPVKPKM